MGNTLITLPYFFLPKDLAWQIGFVEAVNFQLKRLRSTGHFLPPRFFAYYLQDGSIVGVAGHWSAALDIGQKHLLNLDDLKRLFGLYSIESTQKGRDPDFVLVHDRHCGTCDLMSFGYGIRFVESLEPVFEGIGLDSGLEGL